jgi:hypothetical protein
VQAHCSKGTVHFRTIQAAKRDFIRFLDDHEVRSALSEYSDSPLCRAKAEGAELNWANESRQQTH